MIHDTVLTVVFSKLALRKHSTVLTVCLKMRSSWGIILFHNTVLTVICSLLALRKQSTVLIVI